MYTKKTSVKDNSYPNGVPFDAKGYPIFDQYAKMPVKFDFPSLEGKTAGKCLTGNCISDFRLANQAACLASTPPDYTWHHCQDSGKDIRRDPEAMQRKRTGRRKNPLHGFYSYKGKSQQTPENVCDSGRDTEGISGRIERADRPGQRDPGKKAIRS